MTNLNHSTSRSSGGRSKRSLARRWRVQWRYWHRQQRGATTMEWALLLMAIGIPAATISFAVLRLLGQYSKMTLTLTNLPFP
ncbi:MAG: hypothetical protein HC898_08415 [Phycisphaerales bacterium]|nr:hypothetical protein [Phycisphaerales bacterium]